MHKVMASHQAASYSLYGTFQCGPFCESNRSTSARCVHGSRMVQILPKRMILSTNEPKWPLMALERTMDRV